MLFSSLFKVFVAAAVSISFVQAASGNSVEIVGHSGVSGQMMFLGAPGKVYILDKAEYNHARVDGHPAYVVEYDYNSNKYRSMSVRSNTFCAGGMTLGDGRWLVTGGNKAVKRGGGDAKPGSGPYHTYDGGRALRFLNPCTDQNCQWVDEASNQLNRERWYPTVEPLRDGHVAIPVSYTHLTLPTKRIG